MWYTQTSLSGISGVRSSSDASSTLCSSPAQQSFFNSSDLHMSLNEFFECTLCHCDMIFICNVHMITKLAKCNFIQHVAYCDCSWKKAGMPPYLSVHLNNATKIITTVAIWLCIHGSWLIVPVLFNSNRIIVSTSWVMDFISTVSTNRGDLHPIFGWKGTFNLILVELWGWC